MPARWYDNWDESFDLARGGIELSFRRRDINTMLVETDAVRLTRRLISRFSSKGISSRYYIIGDKGYGKSTLLNYITHSLFDSMTDSSNGPEPLPVDCPMMGTAKDERGLDFVFFYSLLRALFELPSDASRLKLAIVSTESLRRLARADAEYKEALTKFGEVPLEFVHTALENQLRHLSAEFQPIVFLVDGLDKFEPSIVLEFLRKSQERLSSFVTKHDCIFIFAADPAWAQTLESHEFTGVKGSPIRLRGWTIDEVWLLIQKRLEDMGIFIPPFSRDAVEQLVSDHQGNPRKILQYATLLLHFGAKRHLESIGPGVTKQIVWSEDQKAALHMRIIEDPEFRYAYEKLRGVVSSTGHNEILIACHTKGVLRRTMNYDERASLGIRMRDDEFGMGIQTLIDRGCLKFGATDEFLQLEDDIRALFDFVKKASASLEALPVVLEDYEATIASTPLPPKEDVIIGGEVKSIFQNRAREWMNSRSVASLMLEDPRRSLALRERFGSQTEQKLTRTVPLIMAQLRAEGFLVYDQITNTMRWRGLLLDKEVGKVFRCREIVEAYEETRSAAERGSPTQVSYSCKVAVENSIDLLLRILSQDPATIDVDRKLVLLQRLNVDLKGPIPLEAYLDMLDGDSTLGPDSIGLLVETLKLYLRRIAGKINEIHDKGASEFIVKIQDPAYYTRVDLVGQKIAGLANKILTSKLAQNWASEIIDKDTFRKTKYRIDHKVPEDPRSEAYEFLTLGELRDVLKKEKAWTLLREVFVNVSGGDADVYKFNSDELFFGSLNLLMEYRNPPSHATYLTIAATNMAMIESVLTKLEKVLGVAS